jgi:hypothetical protein
MFAVAADTARSTSSLVFATKSCDGGTGSGFGAGAIPIIDSSCGKRRNRARGVKHGEVWMEVDDERGGG